MIWFMGSFDRRNHEEGWCFMISPERHRVPVSLSGCLIWSEGYDLLQHSLNKRLEQVVPAVKVVLGLNVAVLKWLSVVVRTFFHPTGTEVLSGIWTFCCQRSWAVKSDSVDSTCVQLIITHKHKTLDIKSVFSSVHLCYCLLAAGESPRK